MQVDRIVASIKDAQFLELFAKDDEPATEHLCGDLWVLYAEDRPDTIRSLKWETIQRAGIDKASSRQIAKENLQRIMPEAERHGDGPWFMLTAGGDYTASLLLFDELWDDMAESVEGRLVAVVPSRDLLLFTGSESAAGIAEIRRVSAEIMASGSYRVSETLLLRKDGRWDVFGVN